MTPEQTNELREALKVLLEWQSHTAFSDCVRNLAYAPNNYLPSLSKQINAARCVARFLEWDDVPDDLPL